MALLNPVSHNVSGDEDLLRQDPRWLLVQRITETKNFERATQLRKILGYVTRTAILEPERVLREFDIAYEVLGRRKDFDPASDNIVRSQFSHLRRKLELYFDGEGKLEPLVVKIPKGGYVPLFTPANLKPQVAESPSFETPKDGGESKDQSSLRPTSGGHQWAVWSGRERRIAAICLAPSIILALVFLFPRNPGAGSHAPATSNDNAFVKFLGRWEGEVTVVVPDTALLTTELGLNIEDVPLTSYTSGRYPEDQLSKVADPKLRQTLGFVAAQRSTTYNEAMLASNFVDTMRRVGLNAKPRYSRDIHVSDLNEGNTILIGGQASNPWVSLFADKLNFRFVEERSDRRYYFLNVKPGPGELATYTAIYSYHGSDAVGYADVALTQNPSHTGYILLVTASDQQQAESAAHLLLKGKLPPEISALLERKDLHSFEIFFRGKHIDDQADDSLELVAYRPL